MAIQFGNDLRPQVVEEQQGDVGLKNFKKYQKVNAMGDKFDFEEEYKGLKNEDARKQAIMDFMGYGEELDKKVWEDGSIGHKRALANRLKALEWLQKYNPTAYGKKTIND